MKLKSFKISFIILFLYLWYRALFNNDIRVIYNMPNYLIGNVNLNQYRNYCYINRQELKIPHINLEENFDMNDLETENIDVKIGGHWSPKNCIPFQKVAVILPFKNRRHQIRILIKRLHQMLKRQKISYTIFVITQINESEFNRGLILNIGVIEAMKLSKFDCIVFNDVDLIPEMDENIYFCDNGIRQISSAIDDLRYHVKFWNNAGGVISISLNNYFLINGHPNVYWGWGNEDDDFSIRSMLSNLKLSRPYEHIGKFKMIKHLRDFRKLRAYWLFLSFRGRWSHDGLNSLIRIDDSVDMDTFLQTNQSNIKQNNKHIPFKSPYQLVGIFKHKLYTNISVRVKNLTNKNFHKFVYTWESISWFLTFYGWL